MSAGADSDRDPDTPQLRPFAVVAVKDDCRRVLFGRYSCDPEAQAMAAALRRVGLSAVVMTGNDLPERPGEAVRVPAATDKNSNVRGATRRRRTTDAALGGQPE